MFKPITSRVNKLVRLCDGEKINSELLSAILMYLIITPIDAILYMQWINTMSEYTWMAGAVIYPLFGLLFFAIPTLIMQHKKYILGLLQSSQFVPSWITEKFDKNIEEIVEEQTNLPQAQLAQIGSMDSASSLLGALSAPFISIMLSVIVGKLTLPMTMLTSYIFLGKRYKKYNYLGMLTTMFGIIVAAIPKLYLHNTNTEPIWLLIYICSLIPSVASYIIKELYLTQYANANSWYMNTIISIYQVVIGVCSLALLKLPIPAFYVEDMGKYINDSIKCQFTCGYSFLYLLAFQIFGTIANILMFKIIKKGSSVTFIMINTIKMPVTALMGFFLISFRVITYTEEQKFVITWLDIVGLILIIIGACLYTSSKEKRVDDVEQDNKYKLLGSDKISEDDSDDEKQILLNEIVEC